MSLFRIITRSLMAVIVSAFLAPVSCGEDEPSAPGPVLQAPCSADADCHPELFCLILRDGTGLCSRECATHADCGGDSFSFPCGIRPDGVQACVPSCLDAEGYACVDDTSVACEIVGEA